MGCWISPHCGGRIRWFGAAGRWLTWLIVCQVFRTNRLRKRYTSVPCEWLESVVESYV